MTDRSAINDEYSVDLHSDVKMLFELVADLDTDVHAMKDGYSSGPGSLEPDLIALAMIQEARRLLGGIETDLTNLLAAKMPHTVVVEGTGTFEKHKKTNRTKWDREALLPDVLDTRTFDKTTGELIEETPLDKVLKVWNLGAPRTTVLKDRGLQADEYCVSEDAGYTIRLIN